MKIGIIIKTLRKNKGIKQKELALKLGISNAYLSPDFDSFSPFSHFL